jgi:hypothetical protein
VTTIFDFLETAGFIGADEAQRIADRCRDVDVAVFRDRRSGVIYLDPQRAGVTDEYYDRKDTGGRVFPRSEMDTLDTARRSRTLLPLISGKRWVDFGCGPGYQLRRDAWSTSAHLGVELNQGDRDLLERDGYSVTANVDDVASFRPEVISLFHVAEHLLEAPKILTRLRDAAADGCRMVIEVPHAGDWLIAHGPDAFRQFTFWGEHLVLHTMASISYLIEETGWEVMQAVGVQRYPLANHLTWLTAGKPSGASGSLVDTTAVELHRAYEAYLAARNVTDTLLVMARRRA